MDEVVSSLLSYSSVILSLAVVILTFFIRGVVEVAVPSVKKAADENSPDVTYKTSFSEWWNKVILYAIPVVIGATLAVTVKDLAPQGFVGAGGALIYGAIVGWFSSFLYKVFRKILKARTGLDLPGSGSVPPPSDAD